jgi:hypothetical protein
MTSVVWMYGNSVFTLCVSSSLLIAVSPDLKYSLIFGLGFDPVWWSCFALCNFSLARFLSRGKQQPGLSFWVGSSRSRPQRPIRSAAGLRFCSQRSRSGFCILSSWQLYQSSCFSFGVGSSVASAPIGILISLLRVPRKHCPSAVFSRRWIFVLPWFTDLSPGCHLCSFSLLLNSPKRVTFLFPWSRLSVPCLSRWFAVGSRSAEAAPSPCSG